MRRWIDDKTFGVLCCTGMQNTNNFLIPFSILLAGGMVALAVFFGLGGQTGAPVAQEPTLDQQPAEDEIAPQDVEVDLEGFAALGDPDAPVLMVEYSDFACPFCARFHQQTKDQIVAEYVEAGIVQFVRKDFIAVGGDRAAEAAHCAGDQGAYWEYTDVLYANQEADRGNWASSDVHRGYAEQLGLDANALVSCFEDRTHQGRVGASSQEAVANGGQGTPYFVINGIPVSGAQPFNVFEQAIELALSEAD